MAIINGLQSPSDGNLSPSLALGDFRGTRYPNQFFDLSQQYMPPTIKELFRWCTFYYYNSPLMGAAIRKIARYPITDLIFEDEHETVRELWSTIFNDILKIKSKKLEINLDNKAYGNGFVSLHKPFTRFLICHVCRKRAPIKSWDWRYRSATYTFAGKCPSCKSNTDATVKDVPYRDIKGVKLIRWNPENIHIKFNEYTGRYIYMYSVPAKLRNAIQRGDKDILEDIPLIVLDAVKSRRMIRFDQDNIFHLKAPTLAEQDQGWGKPLMLHVLKDLFYFYTLRRAQEAIALEHILPLDMVYPLPNGQQDPYVHSDLGNWRSQIEQILFRHRRDPNFKAVIPIPVGTVRVGGDGKALMLNPEMQYITQTVVGGMGIPQEFLFGGLNWTGSSISLRTLENDFVQDRVQLLDLCYWIKNKLRSWMNLPDIQRMRFSDFRMADDVQRNQQVVGLNAQGKLSDQTMLTELGFDYEQEVKKKIEEVFVNSYIADLQAKAAAKTQGESSIITTNYQSKLQEITAKAQQELQAKGLLPAPMLGAPGDPNGAAAGQPGAAADPNGAGGAPELSGGLQGAGAEWGVGPAGGAGAGKEEAQQADPAMQVQAWVDKWAKQLLSMDQNQARLTLTTLKAKMPDVGMKVEQAYNALTAQAAMGPGAGQVAPNMNPLPERAAPRRMEITGAPA